MDGQRWSERIINVCWSGTGDEAMGGAEGDAVDRQALLYCERSVELFTDLLSQLPTRRFTHAVLEDKAVLVKCKLSRLHAHSSGAEPCTMPDCLPVFSCATIYSIYREDRTIAWN